MSFVSETNNSYSPTTPEPLERSRTPLTQRIQRGDWSSFESTPHRNQIEEETLCCTPEICRDQCREEAIRRISAESQRARQALVRLTIKWRRDQSMIRIKALADAKEIEDGEMALSQVNKALDRLLLETHKTHESLLQLSSELRLNAEQGSKLAHLEDSLQTLIQDNQMTSVSCQCRLI